MILNKTLESYLSELLQVQSFQDYCPNGLQIEGKKEIKKIVTGVSCNLEFIDKAIEQNADAILVHHGFFWKNEHPSIVNHKYQRIKKIIENDINLFAYHLPLDAHAQFGNNIALARTLGINNPKVIDTSLIWQGELNMETSAFIDIITTQLGRKPQVFGDVEYIKNIAFCTGGAQSYINDIISNSSLDIDCYLSGEVSENIPAIAQENNMLYIGAGHHATEKGGVLSLGTHITQKFDVACEFVDVANIV